MDDRADALVDAARFVLRVQAAAHDGAREVGVL